MIVWIILNLLVGVFYVWFMFMTIRLDIKSEFPKDSFMFHFNNWEGNIESFIKEKCKYSVAKYIFRKHTLVYLGSIFFGCLIALAAISKGLDAIISFINIFEYRIYPTGDYFFITLIFFIVVSIILTWSIFESHFDNIIDDISLVDHNRKLKELKDKYNIEPPKKYREL
jgi:hypothetical protein